MEVVRSVKFGRAKHVQQWRYSEVDEKETTLPQVILERAKERSTRISTAHLLHAGAYGLTIGD